MRHPITALLLLAAIAGVGHARADATLDRKYALERISFLPSWDNVDGLFRPYVEEATAEYFKGHPRFALMDASKARDILLDSKLDYRALLDDPAVLGHAARAVRAESLVRTRVLKEGPKYRVTMDWLHAPRMEILASATVEIKDPAVGQTLSPDDLKSELKHGLDLLVGKLPFLAHVTGRDGDVVTVNAGRVAGIGKGDRLTVDTLEEVKVHPILHSVADWRLERVGLLEVESVDGGMAFCKVVEEETGRQISRFQKVTKVSHPPADRGAPSEADPSDGEPPVGPPRLGWIEAGPLFGSVVRSVSTDARSAEGTAFLLGGQMDSQVWLNRQFFGELAIAFGGHGYSQEDLAPTSGANAVESDGTMLGWKFGLGYTYLLSGDFYGPKGWAKIGYRSTSFEMPSSLADFTGSLSVGGLYFGVGGDLPVRAGWGATVNFEIGVLNGATLAGYTALPAEGATSVRFSLGAYYLIGPRMALKGTVQVISIGAEFGEDGDVSQRVIGFSPALVYFF
ncbi:MAG: hypothetical protein IT285_00630 [Bdellovibrionales bacterium]|nr:hypothetical protein [Bdellovibrionales bacterium]